MRRWALRGIAWRCQSAGWRLETLPGGGFVARSRLRILTISALRRRLGGHAKDIEGYRRLLAPAATTGATLVGHTQVMPYCEEFVQVQISTPADPTLSPLTEE